MKRLIHLGIGALVLLTSGCPQTPPTVHVVEIRWDNVGAQQYNIYRGPGMQTLTKIDNTTGTTYRDQQVQGGQVYYYAVSSQDTPASDESGKSNIVVAAVPQ